MKKIQFLKKETIIFLIFGFLYICLELLYRGHTHISMFFVGGLCGVLIGLINDNTPDMPLFYQCILGTTIVTLIEFISGCYLNIYLGLGVWDYSHVPFNFLGQVCLPFSIIWMLLSIPVIYLDDYLKNKLLKEVQ
jgi:uncharacterized membrane protein